MPLFDEELKMLTDIQLLDRYRRTGGSDSIGALYGRYADLVYGVCLKYLRSVPDAEDTVMELFELLPEKLRRSEIREFRTWLYSVTRNHCLGLLRRAGRMPTAELAREPGEEAEVLRLLTGGEPNEARLNALERCLERLPDPQRRSIRLFFWEKQSYADIAAATSWHVKSVKSYIQNGKWNLRLCLENKKV